jgi:hypothetical protein
VSDLEQPLLGGSAQRPRRQELALREQAALLVPELRRARPSITRPSVGSRRITPLRSGDA